MIYVLLIFLALVVGAIGGGYFAYRELEITTNKINDEVRQKNLEYEKESKRLAMEREFELTLIDEEIVKHRAQLEQTIEQEASIVRTVTEREQEQAREAFFAYVNNLESSYVEAEVDFDTKMEGLQTELDKLRSAVRANVEANLRKQELDKEQSFYKISVLPEQLEDIELLEEIRPRLKNQKILSKIIWTEIYQKGVGVLCNNVVGPTKTIGIYKITDTTDDRAYIGQSVDISQRWKDHVKAALGASNTASNNKLYSAMRAHGIHNFTFEVLERVPQDQLNEKEAYWIEFYMSNVYGLNSVRGVNN